MAKSIAMSRGGAQPPKTSPLTAAWLALFTVASLTTAWLFASADETRVKRQITKVYVPLSTPVAAVTPLPEALAPVLPPPAMTEAPKPPEMPSLDHLPSKTVPKVALAPADTPPAPKAAPKREPVTIAPIAPTEPPKPVEAQMPVKEPAPPPERMMPEPIMPEPMMPEPMMRATATASPDALAPAPEPTMIQQSQFGPLPVIGNDGRAPWQVYARPFPASDTRPRISVVVAGLGLSKGMTENAIAKLPAAVTLAFDPYASDLDSWIGKARSNGHEALLSVPMEPQDFPNSDPGPATLLTTLQPVDNVKRLEWTLARATGYTGILPMAGSKFLVSAKDVIPVLEQLRRRGLMFVDTQAGTASRAIRLARDIGVPRAFADRQIDAEPNAAAIDASLAEIERLARKNGQALALAAAPTPAVIDRIAAWSAKLGDRKFALAPATAIADLQADAPVITLEQIKAEQAAGPKKE